MQDRFKFRVWNKEKQKLYDWDFLMKAKEQNTFFWCMHQVQNNEKYNILMQCTGLKDKNGKLIYEGDIVKIPDNYDEFGQFAGEKYEVYFKAGGFRFKPKFDKKARGCWLEDDNTFEVIGNIYENPELVEGDINGR